MRAERLLRLASDLTKDDKETQLGTKLRALQSAIQAQINAPNATTQTQTAAARDAVYGAVEQSQFNSVTPSLKRDLIELNLYDWTGARLKEQVEKALASGGLIAADALRDVTDIADAIAADVQSATQLVSALGRFNIEPEELEQGEFELSVTIPRKAFHNEVGPLGKELSSLNNIFGVFSEIASGSRENYKLNAISTTDPPVLLSALPGVAALIITSLDKLVSLYEKILTVRKLYNESKRQAIPETVLEGFRTHIESAVTAGIEAYAKDVEAKYLKKTDAGRRNELEQELRRALRQIAERLDVGYDFDVRGREPSEKKETDARRLEQIRNDLRVVEELRPKLQRFEADDEPVLRLSSTETNSE